MNLPVESGLNLRLTGDWEELDLSGVTVLAYNDTYTVGIGDASDANGEIRIGWLHPGTYFVFAYAAAEGMVDDFFRDLAGLRRADGIRHSLITARGWVLYGLAAVLLAWSIDITIGAVWIGVAALTAALAGLIPITVSGVGTRDAVMAGFFAKAGLGIAPAVALSTLLLGLNLAVLLLYWPAYQLAVGRRSEAE